MSYEIEVVGLTKSFGQRNVVEDLHFTVNSGEIMGFLGPNGAGKTSTMRMLTSYWPPSSGKAKVGGFDVFEQSMEVRRRVGYLPEHVPLYHDMEVTEYLTFVAKAKQVAGRYQSGMVDALIERTGLAEVRRQPIATLSKGYRQRVGLAQALVNNPKVLILDEPTTGLDPAQIIEIRQLIKELSLGHTILLSTHILPEVEMVCDRVIIINRGQIVAIDTVENLTRELTKTQMTSVVVAGPADQVKVAIRSVPGVLVTEQHKWDKPGQVHFIVHANLSHDIRGDLAKAIVMAGFPLLELTAHTMSLEDIFLELTTRGRKSSSTDPAARAGRLN
ncbi:MAG TPA: ATP-binding cassette domain-containing protein [bacterium]|nr:ATP-binding cassette domain-containing protein [bacterium]